MKRIISFSLWGDNPKYTIGAIRNAELTNELFYGWISRFYCGQSVPIEIIRRLGEIENCEVVIQNEMGDFSGTFWRFISISDEDVEVAISRDCDSRLSMRERLAVDEWLNSDKLFHIMRDHPWHCTEILGGMWGVRAPLLKDMRYLVNQHNKGTYYQVDQDFLRSIIYPLVKDNSFVHDEFFDYNNDKRRFPSERVGQMFVGEIFDEFENPIQEHRRLLDKIIL